MAFLMCFHAELLSSALKSCFPPALTSVGGAACGAGETTGTAESPIPGEGALKGTPEPFPYWDTVPAGVWRPGVRAGAGVRPPAVVPSGVDPKRVGGGGEAPPEPKPSRLGVDLVGVRSPAASSACQRHGGGPGLPGCCCWADGTGVENIFAEV